MKVKELKERLSYLPQDAEVCLSDAELNDIREMSEVAYIADGENRVILAQKDKVVKDKKVEWEVNLDSLRMNEVDPEPKEPFFTFDNNYGVKDESN